MNISTSLDEWYLHPMPDRLFIIKLSGSLFSSSEFGNVCNAILCSLNDTKDLYAVLVAGGGECARKYIAAGKKLGFDQATLDQLGIEASRVNAQILSEALRPQSSQIVPKSLSCAAEEIAFARRKKKPRLIVCGGFNPGQSTNAVAALIAEKTNADLLINATDVDGVYDKDPSRFKQAVKLEKVTPQGLSSILQAGSIEAGEYDLMDPVALRLISRSRIPTKIVKCKSSVLYSILHNKNESSGTTIVFDN